MVEHFEVRLKKSKAVGNNIFNKAYFEFFITENEKIISNTW